MENKLPVGACVHLLFCWVEIGVCDVIEFNLALCTHFALHCAHQ